MTGPFEREISVLVVDDEVDLCDVIAFDLKLSGLETHQAHSGAEALQLLETERVDFVLSDIRMPGIGGLALLDAIKRRDPDRPLVLFMSAFSDISLEEALDRGAERMFSKPFEPEELQQSIARLLLPPDRRWSQKPTSESVAFLERHFESFRMARSAGDFALGRGGFFVEGDVDLAPGAPVGFHVRFAEGELPSLKGEGVVCWNRSSIHGTGPAGAGVEITYLEPGSRAALVAWLAASPCRAFIPRR